MATLKRSGLGIWLDPSITQSIRADLFSVIVPVNDPDYIFLIADGYFKVERVPDPADRESLIQVLREKRPLKANLLQVLGEMGLFTDSTMEDDILVYCESVVAMPVERSITLSIGLRPPASDGTLIPHRLKSAAVVQVSQYRSTQAKLACVAASNELDAQQLVAKVAPDKRDQVASMFGTKAALDSIDPVTSHFTDSTVFNDVPVGLAVSVASVKHGVVERAALAAIQATATPFHAPPETGDYQCVVTAANPKDIKAIITWKPHVGLTPYTEIRRAVERRLPRAFLKPRLDNVAPPTFNTRLAGQIHQFPIHGIEGFDPRDPAWLDAFEGRSYDFGDRKSRSGATRAAIKTYGFEAIAWYQPFHTFTEDAWGIYFDAAMLDEAVCALSEDLSDAGIVNLSDALASQLVFGMVYQHELFHAQVEAASSWLELTTGQARFRRYQDKVYRTTFEKPDCLEEALANWWSWSWFKTEAVLLRLSGALPASIPKDSLENIVESTLDMSPPGYDQWRIGHGRDAWRALATQIAAGKVELARPGIGLPIESMLKGPMLFNFQPDDIPMYFVGDGQVARRLLSSPVTLNVPSRSELRRALSSYFKYTLIPGAGAGSHEKWRHQNGRMFPVPMRDPVSRKVFKAFLDHFGINKHFYAHTVRPTI